MEEKKRQRDIYVNILAEIEKLLSTLEKSSCSHEVEQYREEAIKKLDGVKKEVIQNINSLEENSEWNTFTIAFYGETNAGKSTLIESLRIFLNEHKKIEEHKLFNTLNLNLEDICRAIGNRKEVLNEISERFEKSKKGMLSQINNLEAEVKQSNLESENSISNIEQKITQYDIEVEEITNKIVELEIKKYHFKQDILNKMLSSVWNMVKSRFNKLEEQNKVEKLTLQIASNESDSIMIQNWHKELIEKISDEESRLNAKIKNIKNQQQKLETNIENLIEENNQKSEEPLLQIQASESTKNKIVSQLQNVSDGSIVGDGRSDFTQEVTDYHFNIGDKRFVILDLPGIEGNERGLQESINQAVEKAHAVFYVSKKPTPPQKGDDKNLGTIEKISKQLSKHSEVHFIYNKPVRNPRQLKKTLIEDDEKKSLLVVDDVLSNVFGENYISHHSLTAYPAFLALGNFHDGKFEKDRTKFIDKLSTQSKVLEYSLISEFAHWMTGKLVIDVKNKIVISNFKKINATLDKTVDEIRLIDTEFNNLKKTLTSNFDSAINRLNQIGETYEKNIKNNANKEITTVKNNIRKKIYSDIDNGLDNKQFNNILKKTVENGIKEFVKNMDSKIMQSGKEFENAIADVVYTYQRYVKELVDKFSNSVRYDFEFNPEVKFKMNIDVASILGIVLAIVFALNNPMGWVILGISVLTPLYRGFKKIQGLLDKEVHKAQQRKIATANIDKAFETIEQQLSKQLSGVRLEVQNAMENIANELRKPVIQVETMSEIFFYASNSMGKLSLDVIKEGEKYIENN